MHENLSTPNYEHDGSKSFAFSSFQLSKISHADRSPQDVGSKAHTIQGSTLCKYKVNNVRPKVNIFVDFTREK